MSSHQNQPNAWLSNVTTLNNDDLEFIAEDERIFIQPNMQIDKISLITVI